MKNLLDDLTIDFIQKGEYNTMTCKPSIVDYDFKEEKEIYLTIHNFLFAHNFEEYKANEYIKNIVKNKIDEYVKKNTFYSLIKYDIPSIVTRQEIISKNYSVTISVILYYDDIFKNYIHISD